MSKHGNKNSEKDDGPRGPCTRCKIVEGPFKSVRSHSPTGKAKMISLCADCLKNIGL